MGMRKRKVLPLSQQSTGAARGTKCPSPSTTASSVPVRTRAHSCAAAPSVAEMSLLNSRLVIWLRPSASAAQSTARWAMLLLGGAVMVPEILLGDRVIVTSIDKPFRRLALSVIAYAMPPCSPFCRSRDIFPRPGEVYQRERLWQYGKVSGFAKGSPFGGAVERM